MYNTNTKFLKEFTIEHLQVILESNLTRKNNILYNIFMEWNGMKQ